MKNKRDNPAEAIAKMAQIRGIFPQMERRKPFKRSRPLPGRNDPCPCGSGKKFKHCHEIEYLAKLQERVISNNQKSKTKQYGK